MNYFYLKIEQIKNMKLKNNFHYWAIISGFLIHLVLGTLQSWPSICNYFHSFLVQKNSIKFSKVYLKNIFSLVIVFNNIFILIGILLTKKYNAITITGFGLLLKIYANVFILFCPNIIVVTFCIFICSSACGICYMPIILEIWKYFPKNKGLATSLALSGYGFTQLLFEYISIYFINKEKQTIDYKEGVYSSKINDNFKEYFKMNIIFFSVMSIISIIILYPHDKYKKILRKKVPKYNFQYKNLINNVDENDVENNADGINEEIEFNQSAHLFTINERTNSGNDYFSAFKKLFLTKKAKPHISSNKKYKKEDLLSNDESKNELEEKLVTDVHLFKVDKEKQKNSKVLLSLIASYPFLQLTSIFFFTKVFGVIELSSIKNFGVLNGYDEDFLWYGTLLFKITNFFCFPLFGFLFDKIGFKKFYRIIITLEILISSLCYYISTYKFGYLFYCIISAFINTASMAIGPTNFSIIFDNEKGALLFGISCFLTNSFYIFRPLISTLLTEKIYFLIIYLVITLFSMLGFIILCFFIDEKFVNNNSSNNSNINNDVGQEMNDINFSDKNDSSANGSISKNNSINYDTNNTGYTKDKNELFSEKEHDESSTFN